MAETIRDVMTADPISLPADSSVAEAAKAMRDADVGPVIVVDNDEVAGILTDRDIAIRVVAEGKDPGSTQIGDVASRGVSTLSPDDSIESAIKLMRDNAVRRVPVVDGGRPVGIVSIGDLAIERDPDSALADISAADPDR